MEYKYSKPTSGSGSYQASPPSRVSPVPAASFSGKSGGGGIFPFIPITDPGLDPTYDDPSYQVAEQAARAASAEQAARADAIYDTSAGVDRIYEQVAEPNKYTLQAQLEGKVTKSSSGTNSLKRMNELYETGQYVTSGQGSGQAAARDKILSGSGNDNISTSAMADRITSGSGTDAIYDPIMSGSGEDRLPDAIYGHEGNDATLWRSFDDVTAELEQLPSTSITRNSDPVKVGQQYAQSAQLQKLNQSGTVSLANVNLPQTYLPAKVGQSVTQMPTSDPVKQAMLFVPAAAVGISGLTGGLSGAATKATSNNIVNFPGNAGSSGLSAAAGFQYGSMVENALAAEAKQLPGWNVLTQQYTSLSKPGNISGVSVKIPTQTQVTGTFKNTSSPTKTVTGGFK